MSDYTPIDCGLYSRYELAILRRHRLRLSWRDAGGLARIDTVTPVDLATRGGEEFLVIEQSDGHRLDVRLDRIVRSRELPPDDNPRPRHR
jgi:Rho-binding antiterminator